MYFFVNVTRLFSPDARFFLLKMHQIRFFAVIPPQTPLGELTALPKTLLLYLGKGKRNEKKRKTRKKEGVEGWWGAEKERERG